MISTGGTIAESIEALLDAGARPEIVVAATHGILLNGARSVLAQESVREVFVTDTMPMMNKSWTKLRVVSIAPLIAAAIKQFMTDGSLSALC
jgi:ribose-phosphate pyrophosphokinase